MTNRDPLYLDYAATTPVDPRVIEKMSACLSFEGTFGNAASEHVFGERARVKIEQARSEVARLINGVPRNIVFTASSTEATNLALKGVAHFYADRGKHLVTCKTEHRAVLDSCQRLEQEGYSVTYLDVKENGLLDIEQFKRSLREDTLLVSIMQVNNETGLKQDIAEIGKITRERGIFFHVDGTQSVGKIPINVQELPLDLLSFCGHKFYGPKGVGVLYLGDRPRVQLVSLIHGGGHERKFRAGTLATHQIVGMGEACRVAREEMSMEFERMVKLRRLFWEGIGDLEGVVSNSDEAVCVPNIINVCFQGIRENFMNTLSSLACSTASACNSVANEPSHVLRAMGLSEEQARHSLRFSFGRMTTEEDIEYAVKLVRDKYLENCV